jgi:formate hydrogenlyase subunit 6/NADH:ubiquinone oxidoreductase subunit I
MIITDDCMSCGGCEEICPQGAIQAEKKSGYAQYKINQELCIDCGICLDYDCPGDAIRR